MYLPLKNIAFTKKSILTKLFIGFFAGFLFLSPVMPSFSPGFSVAHAQTTNTGLTDKALGSLDCGVGAGTGAVEDCFVYAMYYLIYYPTSLFLRLTGMIFDVVTAFTLSSTVIGGPDFITVGWTMVRDVVNAVFIFVVLYIAIALILRIGTINAKRTLVMLIVMALLINFSLFFSRLIIDASNVVAYTFYEHMGEVKTDPTSKPSAVGISERTLSVSIMDGLDPQSLFGNHAYQALTGSPRIKDATQSIALIFLFILAAVVTFITAIMLIVASLMFLGRIVALWLLMIIAPAALAAFILPQTKSMGQRWLRMLISQAMVAPIFLFLLYFLLLFIDQQQLGAFFFDGDGIDGFFEILTKMILVGAFYITLLGIIMGATKSASGKTGDMSMKAGGLAFGAASVGGYLGGRVAGRRMGRYADQKDETGARRIDRWRAKNGFGRLGAGVLDKGTKGSWNMQNTRFGSMVSKRTRAGALGAGLGRGGHDARVAAKNAKRDQVEKTIQDPSSLAKYQNWRDNESFLGKQTRAGEVLTNDAQHARAEFGQLTSGESKADFIKTQVGKDIGQQIYNGLSFDEKAEINNAAKGLGPETEQYMKDLHDNFEALSEVSAAAALTPTARRKEEEKRQKEMDKANAKVAYNAYKKAGSGEASVRQEEFEKLRGEKTPAGELSNSQKEFFHEQLSTSGREQLLRETKNGAMASALQKEISDEERKGVDEELYRKQRREEKSAEQSQNRVKSEMQQNKAKDELEKLFTHGTKSGDSGDFNAELNDAVKNLGNGVKGLSESMLESQHVQQKLNSQQWQSLEKAEKLKVGSPLQKKVQANYQANPGAFSQEGQDWAEYSPGGQKVMRGKK